MSPARSTQGRARARRRCIYAVAVPVISFCMLGLWSVGARAAAPVLGMLSFQPASATAAEPITLQTVSGAAQKGCPTGTQAVMAWVNGPTDSKWTDIIGLSLTTAGVSTTDDMTFPMSYSFSGLASVNALAIVPGRYDLRLSCLDKRLGGTSIGDFVGSLWFTTPDHFQSTDPGSPGPTTPAPTTPAPATTTPAPTASTPVPTTDTQTTPAPTTSTGSGLPSFGTLSFQPAQGTDLDPITAQTHSTSSSAKGCPSGSTYVDGVLFGPGGWAGGEQVVARTTVGAFQAVGQDFLAQMQDSMHGLAAVKNLPILPGRYDLEVTCRTGFVGQTPLGTFGGPFFFTDAHHFQSTDPNAGATDTTTTIAASPPDRADLGHEVTITVEVAPVTAVGTVRFTQKTGDNVVDVGAPVAVSGGKAVIKRSDFAFGLHTFSATFLPADPNRFKTSDAQEDVVYVIAKPLPPLPPAAAILSGRGAVRQLLTCAATFRNATSTSTVWLRDGAAISGATARTYRVSSADKGHYVACRVSATNAGGTTRRTSAYVRVTA